MFTQALHGQAGIVELGICSNLGAHSGECGVEFVFGIISGAALGNCEEELFDASLLGFQDGAAAFEVEDGRHHWGIFDALEKNVQAVYAEFRNGCVCRNRGGKQQDEQNSGIKSLHGSRSSSLRAIWVWFSSDRSAPITKGLFMT